MNSIIVQNYSQYKFSTYIGIKWNNLNELIDTKFIHLLKHKWYYTAVADLERVLRVLKEAPYNPISFKMQ